MFRIDYNLTIFTTVKRPSSEITDFDSSKRGNSACFNIRSECSSSPQGYRYLSTRVINESHLLFVSGFTCLSQDRCSWLMVLDDCNYINSSTHRVFINLGDRHNIEVGTFNDSIIYAFLDNRVFIESNAVVILDWSKSSVSSSHTPSSKIVDFILLKLIKPFLTCISKERALNLRTMRILKIDVEELRLTRVGSILLHIGPFITFSYNLSFNFPIIEESSQTRDGSTIVTACGCHGNHSVLLDVGSCLKGVDRSRDFVFLSRIFIFFSWLLVVWWWVSLTLRRNGNFFDLSLEVFIKMGIINRIVSKNATIYFRKVLIGLIIIVRMRSSNDSVVISDQYFRFLFQNHDAMWLSKLSLTTILWSNWWKHCLISEE